MIVIKNVYGFKYYWNARVRKWEGLRNNATVFGRTDADGWVTRFERNQKENEFFTAA